LLVELQVCYAEGPGVQRLQISSQASLLVSSARLPSGGRVGGGNGVCVDGPYIETKELSSFDVGGGLDDSTSSARVEA